MKKLNKKGFTLVELLAVIVILALLIVVVATSVLPALNNAKKSALKTYSERVKSNAIQLCMSSEISGSREYNSTTKKCEFDAISKIMGSSEADTQYEVSTNIVVVKNDSGNFEIDSGAIKDKGNNLTATYDKTSKTFKTE